MKYKNLGSMYPHKITDHRRLMISSNPKFIDSNRANLVTIERLYKPLAPKE